MNDAPAVEFVIEENEEKANARNYLTPECVNAALLVSSNLLGKTPFPEAVLELARQTTAINRGDPSRRHVGIPSAFSRCSIRASCGSGTVV